MLKYKRLLTLLVSTAFALFGQAQCVEPTQKMTEQKTLPADDINIEIVSEAFGHFIGRNLQSPGVQFDLESVVKGIRNGASGNPAPMSDQDYELAMTKLQERAYETLSKENLEAANNFMTKNVNEKGVIVLEPGKLQYTVLENGDGKTVEAHGRPLIHYTGKYLDGTVFGSSEEVGGPITIPLDQTIPGFSKGLLGMKEGEKRRLFIHPDLGYGTLGNLPPNALLIFDIEIIKAEATDDLAENEMQPDDYYDEDNFEESDSEQVNPNGQTDDNEETSFEGPDSGY